MTPHLAKAFGRCDWIKDLEMRCSRSTGPDLGGQREHQGESRSLCEFKAAPQTTWCPMVHFQRNPTGATSLWLTHPVSFLCLDVQPLGVPTLMSQSLDKTLANQESRTTHAPWMDLKNVPWKQPDTRGSYPDGLSMRCPGQVNSPSQKDDVWLPGAAEWGRKNWESCHNGSLLGVMKPFQN